MITAHMVVKNEDRFIWYAISSVLPYVDKFLIYDTGSEDDTVKIIQSFSSDKIIFCQFKVMEIPDIAKLRDKQIKETKTGWIWIVDGDEVYPESLCEEIKKVIRTGGDKMEGIVVGRYDLLGDIYHYQDESVGSYEMFGRTGHMVLRLININNIKGIKVSGNYPYESYLDQEGVNLIFHQKEKYKFTEGKLFHAMYLMRSSKGANLSDTFHRKKHKLETGHEFPPNMIIPEVFAVERPKYIADATGRRSLYYEIGAFLITPFKKLKRIFVKN